MGLCEVSFVRLGVAAKVKSFTIGNPSTSLRAGSVEHRGTLEGAPLDRAAFLLDRDEVECTHEERTGNAKMVRGKKQVYADGG